MMVVKDNISSYEDDSDVETDEENDSLHVPKEGLLADLNEDSSTEADEKMTDIKENPAEMIEVWQESTQERFPTPWRKYTLQPGLTSNVSIETENVMDFFLC